MNQFPGNNRARLKPPDIADGPAERSGPVFLAEALEISDIGIWEWNLSDNRLHWSEKTLDLWGFAPGTFNAAFDEFAKRIYPADHSALQAALDECLGHGNQRRIQQRLRLIMPDASLRWVEILGTVERDTEGRPGRLFGVVMDITERQQTEQALRTNEGRYRALVEDTPALICSFLRDGEISFANRAYCDYFGTTPEAILGSSIFDLIPEPDRGSLHAKLEALNAAEPHRTEDRKVIAGDGQIRWQRWTDRATFNAAGEVCCFQSIGEDITASKQHEAALALQARRAELQLELPRMAETLPEVQLLQHGLESAEELTGSSLSFAHLVNDSEKRIELVAWSRRTLEGDCELVHETHYSVSDAGIWADAVRRHAPVFINDYDGYHEKRGLPEGHAALRRLLSVPVIEQGQVVMLVGVGNKSTDYNDADLESLQLIANELWRLAQRQRSVKKLRLAERVLHDMVQGVAITDAAGNLVSVNPAFEQITGYTGANVLGKNPRLLQSGRHDHVFFEDMWNSLTQIGHWSGEIWNRRKNGEVYPEWLSISAVHDERQQISHYVAVFSDISNVKEAQQQIDFLARHDALTLLPNRTLFAERLGHALAHAREDCNGVAVLFIDLDRFKTVNDTLGHRAGDEVLIEVAQRIGTGLLASDALVARMGADEFALLLEAQAVADHAATIARALLETLASPIPAAGHALVVTPSVGISLYPDDGDDADTLIREAAQAMDAAKQQGGNNFQFFTRRLTEGVFERLLLENALRGAVQRNELLLMYQPQIDLTTGRLAGVEALVRWQHPELGLVPPVRFIGLAESIGVIHDIGAWVLRAACEQMTAWDAQGLWVPQVAVNLSVKQLERGDFVAQVEAVLRDCALEPKRLELEVTESMLMRSPDAARAVLTALKAIGSALALDDFGTGYSSLAMLRLLPLDRLKIDQSFVRDIGSDDDDEAIVRAIIALASSLGLEKRPWPRAWRDWPSSTFCAMPRSRSHRAIISVVQ